MLMVIALLADRAQPSRERLSRIRPKLTLGLTGIQFSSISIPSNATSHPASNTF